MLHYSFAYKLVENKIKIDYHADADHVIQLINDVLAAAPAIYQDKKPLVGINGFNTVGIEIGVRYWVPTTRYFEEKYHTNLAIIKALNQAKIKIPCPVKEIHLQH